MDSSKRSGSLTVHTAAEEDINTDLLLTSLCSPSLALRVGLVAAGHISTTD